VNKQKHILVAPLNWGLGHATRCIPIIRALLANDYKVTLASDGQALALLEKEFPALPLIELPSYKITYSEKGSNFKQKIVRNIPQIINAIKKENKVVNKLIDSLKIDGVISDNRLGLYSSKVPTVIISHQLNVLSGRTTWISTRMHRHFIQRFNECWVPDSNGSINLSGRLGHPEKKLKIPTKYLGVLSRMTISKEILTYKAIAIISGPEPQRSLLQTALCKQLRKFSGKVLLVEGKISDEQETTQKGNLTIVNYLTSSDLEKAINQSEFVISRSGYTTVMDLARLQKKAFFIPTPGQSEQEYLANRLKQLCIAPFSSQEDFRVKDLAKVKVYKGFNDEFTTENLNDFFSLFQGEGKLRTHSKFALNINLFFVRLNNMFNNRQTQA